jgi:hypothetical protein
MKIADGEKSLTIPGELAQFPAMAAVFWPRGAHQGRLSVVPDRRRTDF